MADTTGQIAELQRQIQEAVPLRARVVEMLDTVKADDSVTGAAARSNRIEDLTAVIQAIDSGTLGRIGIPLDLNELLKPLLGRPSPAKLRERIEQLEAARDAELHQQRDTTSPAGRFRFTGKGKHFVGTGESLRRVKPGEVIELTVGQAEAFADKFERVEASS